MTSIEVTMNDGQGNTIVKVGVNTAVINKDFIVSYTTTNEGNWHDRIKPEANPGGLNMKHLAYVAMRLGAKSKGKGRNKRLVFKLN